MIFLHRIVFLLTLLLLTFTIKAQTRKIVLASDTILLSESPIISSTFILINSCNKDTISIDTYTFNSSFNSIILNKKPACDTLEAIFYTYNNLIRNNYFSKWGNYKNLKAEPNKPYKIDDFRNETDIFSGISNLDKNGSLTRGISVGNTQNAVFTSGLNLQLAGKINDELTLEASVTDNNLPFQPDGYTQQIQDFDRVYLKLFSAKSTAIAGDFDMKNKSNHFLRYNKNAQGLFFQQTDSFNYINTNFSAGLSSARGRFGRNTFVGQEGNQGPYKLTGNENESFIVVLAASERVYIDGELLLRGEQNDYIIDYNLAEITFMPRRVITNQARIIIEFEYANQAYLRTISSLNTEISIKNSILYFELYSEKDSKNQALQQDLSLETKTFLSTIGNNTQDAFINGFTIVNEKDNSVLYKLVDSLGFKYFEESKDSSNALYKVSFSYLGNKKGNYIQSKSTLNGRVYVWKMPIINGNDTILQGDYEPIIKITLPNKKQLAIIGLKQKIGKNTNLKLEYANSKLDPNLFSLIDDSLNQGNAFFLELNHTKFLNIGTKKIESGIKLKNEFLDQQFNVIQPYRNAEFARDWNQRNIYSGNLEILPTVELYAKDKKNNQIKYAKSLFIQPEIFFGNRDNLELTANLKSLSFYSKSSLQQNNSSLTNGTFNRFYNKLAYAQKKWGFQLDQTEEQNKAILTANDSLQSNSFKFDILQSRLYFKILSSSQLTFTNTYRSDNLIRENTFYKSQVGWINGLNFKLNENQNHTLNFEFNVRNIEHYLSTGTKTERFYLGQLEHSDLFLNGFLSINSFLSTSTGRELKRDYTFLKVLTGSGTHQWRDYNTNGIEELNEFEIAFFVDSANYIKIFIPSNEYIDVLITRFSQSVSLDPNKLESLSNNNFLKKFSSSVSINSEKKNFRQTNSYLSNPYLLNFRDTNLIFSNSIIRTGLFYNRFKQKFGTELFYNISINNLFTTNGIDSRFSKEYNLKSRFTVSNKVQLQSSGIIGNKIFDSQFFNTRDYSIIYQEITLGSTFSINDKSRFSQSIRYNEKTNQNFNEPGNISDKAKTSSLESEFVQNSTKNGVFNAKMAFTFIQYNTTVNSPIAFEMLQGLQPGANITWNTSWFKNLNNNIQLNTTYEGRKNLNAKAIHIIRIQGRVLF